MKVTIIETDIRVEDGPTPDPALQDEDGRVVAMLQALTWAMARISETTAQIRAVHQQQAVASEQANQVLARLRGGMH